MKRALLAPENDKDEGRQISMSNVHGTFFAEPKDRWFETHNASEHVRPAEDFKQRLYPLDSEQYSPWEPTVADMTPMSKAVGACYSGKPVVPKAAITPAKMGHIQG